MALSKMPTCEPEMSTACMADAAQMMPAWPQVICTVLQVVLTTIDPSRRRQDLSYDAYEYTVRPHMYWLNLLLCLIAPVLPIPNVTMKVHIASRLLCSQPCLQAKHALAMPIPKCTCVQVHSHTYDTAEIPSAKFTYDLSPIQILVSEKHRAW